METVASTWSGHWYSVKILSRNYFQLLAVPKATVCCKQQLSLVLDEKEIHTRSKKLGLLDGLCWLTLLRLCQLNLSIKLIIGKAKRGSWGSWVRRVNVTSVLGHPTWLFNLVSHHFSLVSQLTQIANKNEKKDFCGHKIMTTFILFPLLFSLSLLHTHAHTFTLSLSSTRKLTWNTYTLTQTLSLSLSLSFSLSLSQSLSLSLSLSLMEWR